MSNKALVLCSGGLDSTTCLALAIKSYGKENTAAVSVVYGQKHMKEIACAKKVCEHYGVDHRILDLSQIFAESSCSLLSASSEEIPSGSYESQINETGKVSTYVPFRNGLMIAAVASLAQSIWPDDEVSIYLGAHKDDAAGEAYPDCSKTFTDAMDAAVQEGTYHKVKLVSPFVEYTKADIVRCGLEMNVPYELTWSCYKGGEHPCHKCGTCIDREKAFEANGTVDPLIV